MIKAVLFDMDGILYDSEYYYMEGTIEQLKRFGYTGPLEAIYPVIGRTMDGTYEFLWNLLDRKYPIEDIKRSNERYFTVEKPIHYKEIMFPGIKEALKELNEMGIQCAVCSSNTRDIVLDSLKEMEIDTYFSCVLCEEDVNQLKPDPEIYITGSKRLAVDPKECIVYEDSTMGIEAGKRAGIFTVARKDDRFLQDQSNADKIVEDINELMEYIRKENAYARSNEN